jgi:hypothetical protein
MSLDDSFSDSIKDEIETVVIPELLELTEQTGYLPMIDYEPINL